jgi:hypothetical protein
MKLKVKHTRGRTRSRWEQQIRKDVAQKEGGKEELGKKLRSCGKTERDGEVWLSDNSHKVEKP